MVLLSFIFSAGAVWQLSQQAQRVHQVIQFTWLAGLPFHMANGQLATFQADWGFLLDPLSSVMILVVTGIGFLIHVYSTGYMAHDNGYYRFFGYLNLFVFFMLMLVLANNYTLLFVGWEGVGLCSYLLIGFYFHKKSAADAGKKAFIVNRVGDAGFILGMLLMFERAGHGAVHGRQRGAAQRPFRAGDGRLRRAERDGAADVHRRHRKIGAVSAVRLAAGRHGRSHAGLRPDPRGHHGDGGRVHGGAVLGAVPADAEHVHVVASMGAFTAILAATIALVQNDIKRVLAYSTVSQLGYMFLALGVGAYWVAIFHLFTHAFFKALLFLCSGSVIHAMGGEQDMRRMGGLKDKIPITHWTMWVGCVAIAGIPGLAGFFSKDEILWQAYSSPKGANVLWVVGLATAGLTAFYMWRLMNMTFYGKSRVTPEVAAHIHESPASMTVPLTVLAVGSVFAGWLGVPKLWTVSAKISAGSSTGWSRSLPRRPWKRRRKASIGLHRMDADGHFHRHGGRRHSDGPLLLPGQTRHSRAHRRQIPGLPHAALQQVVRGRDLRFPVRQRPVQGRRRAAGRVRPQRGGWRRERRGLAHALHATSPCGGTPGSSMARCASGRSW